METNLVLVNYSMSQKNMVFSHQLTIAFRLAKHFDSVSVITLGNFFTTRPIPRNLRVIPLNWEQSQNKLKKVIKLYVYFFGALDMRRRNIVFCHMADVPSAFLAPLTRILKIRHVLWYAHKANSLWFRLASIFVNQIITSTPGSCPYEGNKLLAIGQGVDQDFFSPTLISRRRLVKHYLYIGRIDPSKNVHLIVEVFRKILLLEPRSILSIVGASTHEHQSYYESTVLASYDLVKGGKIIFLGPKTQQEVKSELAKADYFFNAYMGSLDKVLIEATLMKIPVITTNAEYNREFGIEIETNQSIQTQLFSRWTQLQDPRVKSDIIDHAYKIAQSKHTLNSWEVRVSQILRAK